MAQAEVQGGRGAQAPQGEAGQAQGDPRRAGEEAGSAEEGRRGAPEEGRGRKEGQGGRGEEEEARGGREEEAGNDAGPEGEAAVLGIRRQGRRKEGRRRRRKCISILLALLIVWRKSLKHVFSRKIFRAKVLLAIPDFTENSLIYCKIYRTQLLAVLCLAESSFIRVKCFVKNMTNNHLVTAFIFAIFFCHSPTFRMPVVR